MVTRFAGCPIQTFLFKYLPKIEYAQNDNTERESKVNLSHPSARKVEL
jgi:hypothetical protein